MTGPTASASAPVTRAALAVAVVGGVLLVAAHLVHSPPVGPLSYIDVQVYREGALVLRTGGAPYDVTLTAAHLLYTYPPFSLLVFQPLSFLSVTGAVVLAVSLSFVALAGVALLSLRAVGVRGVPLAVGVVAITGVATLLEPVMATLLFGQVNLVILALVLLDATWIGPRWRGLLTGVVAAVKLTPLVVVLYFAWRRDWGAVARLLVAFAVCTALGFLVAPHSSWRFFTQLDDDADRAGTSDTITDQSLRGLLGRVLGESSTTTVFWLATAAITLGLLYAALRRRPSDAGRGARAGERELLALSLVGLTGLLVSPLSWSHHWVWGVPLAIALLGSRRERTGVCVLGVVVTAVLMAGSLVWSHGLPVGWPDRAVQPLAGAGYVLLGLVVLLVTALVPPRDDASSAASAASAEAAATSGSASSAP